MVSNEYWRKSLKEYKKEIDRWLEAPRQDDYMYLAIFIDAITVAGDDQLLKKLKDTVYKRVKSRDVYMANFAKNSLLFETPIGMFSNLISKDNLIDLKKGGIFPMVQGIRSLALEAGIKATNTNDRIRELKRLNILNTEFASMIEEAFDTLLNIRLKERLRAIGYETQSSNMVDIENLNQLELDLLKDSFKIVNKFKSFIAHHFKTSMIQ